MTNKGELDKEFRNKLADELWATGHIKCCDEEACHVAATAYKMCKEYFERPLQNELEELDEEAVRDVIWKKMNDAQKSPEGFIFTFSATDVAKAICARFGKGVCKEHTDYDPDCEACDEMAKPVLKGEKEPCRCCGQIIKCQECGKDHYCE